MAGGLVVAVAGIDQNVVMRSSHHEGMEAEKKPVLMRMNELRPELGAVGVENILGQILEEPIGVDLQPVDLSELADLDRPERLRLHVSRTRVMVSPSAPGS